MEGSPRLPRPLWTGTRPLAFSEAEWEEIINADPLAGLRGEVVEVLYRHWRWAHYLMGRYATELSKRQQRDDAGIVLGFEEPDPDQVLEEPSRFVIPLEEPGWAAHYTWQAVLRTVLEACKIQSVVLPGALGASAELVSEGLQQQRNAVMHPGEREFWDHRLTRAWYEDFLVGHSGG
jgi:hypothetical protein